MITSLQQFPFCFLIMLSSLPDKLVFIYFSEKDRKRKKKKRKKERKKNISPKLSLNGAKQTFSSAAVRIIWVIFSLCSPNISLHIRLTQLMRLSCCVGPSSWLSWARLGWAGSRQGPVHDYGPEGPGPSESGGRKRGGERRR